MMRETREIKSPTIQEKKICIVVKCVVVTVANLGITLTVVLNEKNILRITQTLGLLKGKRIDWKMRSIASVLIVPRKDTIAKLV
jgi:hypothetical protein